MEGVIGNIVSKIDKVLIKLEGMEKSKSKKKQNLGKLFDGLTNDEGGGNVINWFHLINLSFDVCGNNLKLDLAFNNVKPKDWYFVLD